MKIILASQSPRRKEILSLITNNFEVIVSNEEEKLDKMLSIDEQVKALAYMKAKSVFDKTKNIGDRVIIGSDTIVAKDGIIYGKPKNHDDALSMLQTLRNESHEVITAIAIIYEKNGIVKEIVDIDKTLVYINDVTDKELEEWIATNEAYDKAGGYAIQGKFGAFIEKIEGSFFTVVGLPIHKVYNYLKEII